MQKNKVYAVLAIFVLLSISFIGGYVYAQKSGTFTVSSGIYPSGVAFTVWREGTTYYAKDSFGTQPSWSASTNATYIIQSAIDNSDGEVFLPEGTYQVATIPINYRNNTWLRGEGRENTIIEYTGGASQQAVIDSVGGSTTRVENFKVSDLTVDGGGNAQYGIRCENGVGVIENNLVRNFANVADFGIGIIWGWAESPDNSASLNLSSTSGAYILNNIIGFSFAIEANPQGLAGIWVTNTYRPQIRGNIVRDLINSTSRNCRGIVVDTTVILADVSHNRIENVTANVLGGMGIYVIAGGVYAQTVQQINIGNNHINGTERGIVMAISGSARGNFIKVHDNFIANTDGAGVWLANGIDLVELVDNTIMNPARVTQGASYQEVGILLSDSGNNTIHGNFIVDNRTTPLMEYAVYEFGGTANNNSITDNYFQGYATAGFGRSGGGLVGLNTIVKNNYGYVTEDSGTAEASNADAITFNFAFPVAPQTVVITVNENDARYIAQAYSITTTQFSLYLWDDTAGVLETVDKTISWIAEYDP